MMLQSHGQDSISSSLTRTCDAYSSLRDDGQPFIKPQGYYLRTEGLVGTGITCGAA